MSPGDYNKTIEMNQTHYDVSRNGLLRLSQYGFVTILQTIEDINGAENTHTKSARYISDSRPF